MLDQLYRTIRMHKTSRRLLYSICLIGILIIFALPAIALAGPPDPPYEGPEKCASCHTTETEAWQNSPHAQAITAIDEAQVAACKENLAAADCTCLKCHTTDFNPTDYSYAHVGVTCEACHGPYVEDHPKNGVMQLSVDSSVCSNCHTDTYAQWQTSLHAQAGVQCIGCHLSHSQDFRLTDEALCSACHKQEFEDFSHTTHSTEHITCTDCHLSQAHGDDPSGGQMAPTHNFAFAAQACVTCHEEPTTQESLQVAPTNVDLRTQAMGDCDPQLVSQLKVAEQSNKSLQTLSVTGLGMGVGIGGMLGIIAILVLGYISQVRKVKDE